MQQEIKKIQEHFNHKEYCGEQYCNHSEDHYMCRNCDICPENPGAEETYWTEEDIMNFFNATPINETPSITSCQGCKFTAKCREIGVPGILCAYDEIFNKPTTK